MCEKRVVVASTVYWHAHVSSMNAFAMNFICSNVTPVNDGKGS